MTDTFVADVTGSIRRSLFHRIKGYGFSQDELTLIVSGATRAAVQRAKVADLAAVAAAAGPLRTALETASPGDPALDAFATATTGLSPDVMELVDPGA